MLNIDHDLHVHTYLSACCGDKRNHLPENILATARTIGLKTIGFADHIWANPHIKPSPWYRPQNEEQISLLREDLAEVDTDLRVLVGCEAETIAPGRFGISPAFAEQLDFVLLACSHFHMKGFVQQPADNSPRALAEHMITLFLSAVQSGLATAIPHPFMPLGHQGQLDEAVATISDAELFDTLGVAAERGVALEITPAFFPRRNSDNGKATWSIGTPTRVISMARAAGCRFTIGSDAHYLEKLIIHPKLSRFVQIIGLNEADILPLVRSESG